MEIAKGYLFNMNFSTFSVCFAKSCKILLILCYHTFCISLLEKEEGSHLQMGLLGHEKL